jgi:LuxR family transcriptional regulator, maltose regulon positive regulatory protein
LSVHLIAKLATPRAGETIRRARVAASIGRALRSGAGWIAAPAGYGKTTAMVDYLGSADHPHIWFRVDEGDQDIAQFFGYLAQSLGSAEATSKMPVFGPEYADEPRNFARLFFRAYFGELKPGTLLVFDDVHAADAPEFRSVLAMMLRELPRSLRCACLSRTLPGEEFADFVLSGELTVIGRSALEFTDREARSLIRLRLKRRAADIDISAARGWAVGLVLLAERGSLDPSFTGASFFSALGRHFFDTLSAADQDVLLTLNLLPEITVALANAVAGPAAGELLDRLYRRQLLVTRAESRIETFQLHDLLREFLDRCFEERLTENERAASCTRAALILAAADRHDDAVALALRAGSWPLARDLILECAESVLAQGRRATFIDWCAKLPHGEMNAWLCYWLGVSHMPDDAAAERWLSQAWASFEQAGDLPGQCLTVSRAVLVKTVSWRTYEGLSAWTQRALALLDQGLPELPAEDDLLVRIGMLRALNFADEYYRDSPAGRKLTEQLLERLARNPENDPSELRLIASESLIEHSVSTMQAEIFAKAVDAVAEDLSNPDVLPWVLGTWLVAFGSKSGRYFPYSRRGFAYASAEAALRAAIAIGEEESLRNVEFGGLYHLQMQMKYGNDFAGWGRLVTRLAEIADSRFTTQVAVVADCQAALHARQGNFVEAYRDCDRFMAAIEAANEPMVERWPHYITKFQVLLADRKPEEAMELLSDLLPRLEGGALKRTELCILAAAALEAKWNGDAHYVDRLRTFIIELRNAKWAMILLNLPELLADLLADALEQDIAIEYCRSVIQERRLLPPPRRPASWPWPLKVHVLGGLRLERNGAAVESGSKPATRALDILLALAVSSNGTCSLDTLQDRLWPDLDGDQAKAACEQALHRLRKLLGDAELIVQRQGKLRLAADKVWVDLSAWESRLKQAVSPNAGRETAATELDGLFFDFPGPLLLNERLAGWLLPVIERVRREYIDLAVRVGKAREQRNQTADALAVYLRAIDFYPDSSRLHKALIEARLAQDDISGAIEDFERYERTLRAADEEPSPAIRALVGAFRAVG